MRAVQQSCSSVFAERRCCLGRNHEGEHVSIGGSFRWAEGDGITPVDDAAAILDLYLEQTRGEGTLVDGCIELETIRQHFVIAYPGAEGWWEARLEVRDRSGYLQPGASWFTTPLRQGPIWYADSDTTPQEIVDWLRVLCDAAPDKNED